MRTDFKFFLKLMAVSFALFLLIVASATAQRVIPAQTTTNTVKKSSGIVKDASGNYVHEKKTVTSANDKPLGTNYISPKGEAFPLYVSARGKVYCIRVSAKTGQPYKQYMPTE